MNLETFLKWEKNMLREERERLKKANACPVDLLVGTESLKLAENCNRIVLNERNDSTKNATSENSITKSADEDLIAKSSSSKKCNTINANETPNTTTLTTTAKSSMTTVWPHTNRTNAEHSPKGIPVFSPIGLLNETNENAAALSNKSANNLAYHPAVANVSPNTKSSARSKHKKQDEMEQWVTDTFYSYFPGFNDELQKRQRYLRERQQENQQNFLKHQLNHPPLPKNAFHRVKHYDQSQEAVNTARSSSTTTSATTNTNSSIMTHPTDKTDLEIIVNNPGYVPPKQHTPRSNTTRTKLLQDLQHTELSNITSSGGVPEPNLRHSEELASAQKKDYQRELMQQIEEKRRSIEILREKERQQEEALTRRLQEHFKTIQLEEQLEKEKMRADKAHFDSEQSRLMRNHLLAKLKNDAKISYDKSDNWEHEHKANSYESQSQRSCKATGTATTADVATIPDASDNNNKVYKYFSNSARHEYRRGQPLPEELELDLNIATLNDVRNDDELECFHLSEKVCPMCDAPLKSYESCCLRCQKKLSIRMHAQKKVDGMKANSEMNSTSPIQTNKKEKIADIVVIPAQNESYSMICEKCERLYGLCATCLAQNEVCKACHRKRNVCMNCRRTLCTRCLDEIASGRDTERVHVNDREDAQHRSHFSTKDVDSERSFQVLEVNYGYAEDSSANEAPNFDSPRRNVINYSNDHNPNHLNNSSIESLQKQPYSISIERNSIFHPDYDPIKQAASIEKLDSSPLVDQLNIERIRKETDNRLSQYLRNYGDLAINPRTRSRSESGQDRSTQTTPNTAARRDVVMHEEHNLSMPLLREMPKMTRRESNRLEHKKPSNMFINRIEQLKRRWEIPAVQKFTISSTSPKVLTQVGAIRKQLQAEHILQDSLNKND